MPGFTPARSAAILDAELVAGDHLMFSEDGTAESSNLGRVAVGGWDAAVTDATSATKSNTNEITTPAATGTATITHGAIVSAAAAGTTKTKWRPLTTARNVETGTTLVFAAGEVDVILT